MQCLHTTLPSHICLLPAATCTMYNVWQAAKLWTICPGLISLLNYGTERRSMS